MGTSSFDWALLEIGFSDPASLRFFPAHEASVKITGVFLRNRVFIKEMTATERAGVILGLELFEHLSLQRGSTFLVLWRSREVIHTIGIVRKIVEFFG